MKYAQMPGPPKFTTLLSQDGRLTAEGALEEASKEVQAVKEEMEGLKQELNNTKSEATKLIHRVRAILFSPMSRAFGGLRMAKPEAAFLQ